MLQQDTHNRLYVSVILPVRYGGEISYILPSFLEAGIGSWVRVDLAGKIYQGVVGSVLRGNEVPAISPDGKEIQYKPVLAVEELPKVLPSEIALWKSVAQYYMCSVGEVFKAAYPARQVKQEAVKPRKSVEHFLAEVAKWESQPATGPQPAAESPVALEPQSAAETQPATGPQSAAETQPATGTQATISSRSVREPDIVGGGRYVPQLSGVQRKAYEGIRGSFAQAPGKPVLLRGVTGSGKTEIYMTLAQEWLSQGKNVLYMVPEIAISKQLQSRLKRVFGERLLTFHSKQTAAEKARIHRILQYNAAHPQEAQDSAAVVLGTRSSLFLPYGNLGLIIVDEEHDSSYKQTEPAPRYHAKDTAIMLSQIHKAQILLGSATPSFESEYNCISGKFALVELNEKFHGAAVPQVEIVDTIYAMKTRQMVGSFSQKLLNEIRRTVDGGGQVLVFRNRRSYSPIVECQECGEIPKCPHCNVYLSYHKYNNTLRCHYCDYTARFTGVCRNCGTATFKYKGAGTEKLEEELSALLPDISIARYDADITRSKRTDEQTLKDFAQGKIQVLVGTQMISKGFDFEHLKLVAVVQADTILGIQDFRGDEKALQLLSQLMGRTGRRGEQGKLIIQTSQKDHPVLQKLKEHNTSYGSPLPPLTAQLLRERQEYLFAPFVRMVKIVVKHRDPKRLDELCGEIAEKLSGRKELQYKELTGPFAPVIDKVRGEFVKCFYVKFARNANLVQNKSLLQECIAGIKGNQAIVLDVDPL